MRTSGRGGASSDRPVKSLGTWCSVWEAQSPSFSARKGSQLCQFSMPAAELAGEVGSGYFKAEVNYCSWSQRGCQGNNVARRDTDLLGSSPEVLYLIPCPYLVHGSALELFASLANACSLQGQAACFRGWRQLRRSQGSRAKAWPFLYCVIMHMKAAVPRVPPSLSLHPSPLNLVLVFKP